MNCPLCSGKTKCVDTRNTFYSMAVKRKRVCFDCGHKFTTYECAADRADIFEHIRHRCQEMQPPKDNEKTP